MTMPSETEGYNADTPPVTVCGVFYTNGELGAALSGSVSHILRDMFGKSELETEMTQGTTDFHKSHTLAAFRDALMPKLLSGEIRVKDAERFVEENL